LDLEIVVAIFGRDTYISSQEFSGMIGIASDKHKIDLDFISRNWLLLLKLARRGYSPSRSKRLARAIEADRMSLRDLND